MVKESNYINGFHGWVECSNHPDVYQTHDDRRMLSEHAVDMLESLFHVTGRSSRDAEVITFVELGPG